MIELLVVIALLAVLMAIAAPSFASDLSTQSNQTDELNLNAAWNTARRIYLTDNPSYYRSSTQLEAALSQAASQAGVFVASDADPATTGVINVTTDSDQQLLLCARGHSGDYLTIRDDGNGQPLYGKGDSCTSGTNPASPGIGVSSPGPNEIQGTGWTS